MTPAPVVLSNVHAVIWMVLGILVSIVLPLAVSALKKQGRLEAAGRPPTFGEKIAAAWKRYGGNRYLIVLIAAVFVAGVLVLFLDLKFYTTRDAALAGFGWESLVNKLFGKKDDV
jgi:hypothetical protein